MNVPKEVFDEIEKRVRRLNALAEIAEERALVEERRPIPKVQSQFSTYLWVSAAWVIGGLLILYFLRSRYRGILGSSSRASLMVYAVLTVGVLVMVVLYYLQSKGSGEESFDLAERARAARRVVKDFYVPLREALEKGDAGALRLLADKLLEDPLLARAVEVSKEGDPKLMAYALYLYASGNLADPDELREAVGRVDNWVLRLLLGSAFEGTADRSLETKG